MTSAEELARLTAPPRDEAPPLGFEIDQLTYPGGEAVLARAREVMAAVLRGAELPAWFIDLCVDDTRVQSCTLDRWSLRAWRFWLQPENRRWWWWAAECVGEEVRLAVLVRGRPYLRGSLDWLFKASRLPA